MHILHYRWYPKTSLTPQAHKVTTIGKKTLIADRVVFSDVVNTSNYTLRCFLHRRTRKLPLMKGPTYRYVKYGTTVNEVSDDLCVLMVGRKDKLSRSINARISYQI